ncbi:peroxidase 15 [Canna indica]|uniref:Peroxidase 15 n=1 Tax=Canna indica TaxID=4628 RepID=A0AAQ3KIB2_9LILI|nr:peroxidase 15 [Canna indica]
MLSKYVCILVREQNCPQGSTLNSLDPTTSGIFDKNYFTNLQTNEGLLQYDQELLSASEAAHHDCPHCQ